MTDEEWNKYIKIFSKGKVDSVPDSTHGTMDSVVGLFKELFNLIWEIIKVIVQVIAMMIGIRIVLDLLKGKEN